MPLGDSITQGNTERDSYRRALYRRLQERGARVDFVGSLRDNHLGPPPNPDFDLDHEGHWGWTADEILAEIDGWARAARPQLVLLHLGSNDALRGQSHPETVEELARIVAALREVEPRVTVLLSLLIPAAKPEGPRIEELNAQLPALADRLDAQGSRVVLVDQFTGFDPAGDTADGIHPNAAGEAKMAERWLEALLPHL
jgi:lysophospholipase L1-like esterase